MALGFVLAMYMLHVYLQIVGKQRLPVGWLMLSATLLINILHDGGDSFTRLVKQVEWEVLVQIVALYTLTICVERLRWYVALNVALDRLVGGIESRQLRMCAIMLLIVWVYGVLVFVLNSSVVPLMMHDWIRRLARRNSSTPVMVTYALTMALAGNADVLASMANLLLVGVARRHGVKMSYWQFMRYVEKWGV